MFAEGFPKELDQAYLHTVSVISLRTVNNVPDGAADGYNSAREIYELKDGSRIRFPYRIYFEDEVSAYLLLDGLEKRIMIVWCLYETRSSWNLDYLTLYLLMLPESAGKSL